jgi:hypothetical protein
MEKGTGTPFNRDHFILAAVKNLSSFRRRKK